MDTHRCEGDSESERSLRDDPRFKELEERLRRMPPDRQEAALEELRKDHGKEEKEA